MFDAITYVDQDSLMFDSHERFLTYPSIISLCIQMRYRNLSACEEHVVCTFLQHSNELIFYKTYVYVIKTIQIPTHVSKNKQKVDIHF